MTSFNHTRRPTGLRCGRPLAAALMSALALSGCATVDRFGARSARFNAATVDGRSQAILSNVIRAAYGKPLQFTDLTTLTGQATLSGELGGTIPFAVDPSSTARTYSGAPKISGSGTSTFNMANLASREFYNGLQTQISVQNIANFLNSRYDRQLLFFLVISDIEIKDANRRVVFHSDPTKPKNYRLFYQAVSFFREAGLSTRSGKATATGAPIPAATLADPRVVAAMLSQAAGDLSLKEDPDDKTKFRFFKKAGLEFCFDPILIDTTIVNTKPPASVLFKTPSLRSMPGTYTDPIPGTLIVDGTTLFDGTKFTIEPAYFCDAPPGSEKTQKTEIKITTRSVEGIFQFLGEIARTQLGLTGAKTSDALSLIPPTGGDPFVSFRVVEGAPSDAAVTVHVEGKYYSVVTDASGLTDQSTRTFQLLADLLAIQSSAKDLPAPNTISILTP